MTLQELVERLGLAVVARRADVSVATLKRWLSRGPSASGAAIVSGIARRHLASRKAAETRKEGEKFRDSLDEPEDSELEPEQVLPKKPPGKSREVQASKREEGVRAGRREIDSEFNIGETEWVTVGQSVLEVDIPTLIKTAWAIYEESGRDYVSVKFLFFRFIPFNPLYRGEMIKKQGKWVEQWVTTKAVSRRDALERYVEYYMERAIEWAQTRVIFLEMIAVNTFDRKKEMPSTKDIWEKQLRT
jgi:hypothetical protein